MTGAQYSALHNNSVATASVATAHKTSHGGSGHGSGHGTAHKTSGHPKVVKHDRHWGWLWAVLLVAMAGGGVFMLGLRPGGVVPTSADLIAQFQSAAKGEVIDRHVFGGEMVVDRNGGQVSVTARAVPPKICVSAGWELARKGMLSINGVTPVRVSAARLSDMCNDQDDATMTWVPKGKE